MLLAEKPRGTDADPFPVDGLTGGEIHVLGYRGMKEYTLSFDGFAGARGQPARRRRRARASSSSWRPSRVPASRPRPAPSASRSTRSSWACNTPRTAIQFGKPLFAFPRVSGKLAWMATEIMIARQLTLFAAREKDADRRCDLEAGLAKLSGAAGRLGRAPTTRCRSTAATATPWSTRSAACCATRASSTSSRVRRRSRRR